MRSLVLQCGNMSLVITSDLHLSDDLGDSTTAYEWMESCLEQLADLSPESHLLICGDILGTHDRPGKSGAIGLLRHLLKKFDMYSPDRCTVVPGNHDMRNWGVFEATGQSFRGRFVKLYRTRAYHRQFKKVLLKLIGNIALIGLDSVFHDKHRLGPFGRSYFHGGYLGKQQLKELKHVLSLQSVRWRHKIVAIHHPPERRTVLKHGLREGWGGLEDARRFWEIADAAAVDLVVCGHDHENWEDQHDATDVVCTGGLMWGQEGHVLHVSEHGSRLRRKWLRVW